MDCTFGNVHDYDSMIWSLYEIHQREHETVEEYMLRVHEAVAVVKHARTLTKCQMKGKV